MSTVTHKLAEPIQAHGEEVTELELRRPTVQECRNIKVLPYTVGADSYPIPDTDAAGKYIAVCAKIPPTSVNQLALSDFNKMAWAVVGFFLPADSGASAESSS